MEGRVKLTHILLETVVVLLSTLVFFPLSKNTSHFDKNCLLNSNIYVKADNFNKVNKSVSLDLAKTRFGDVTDCHFTTFFSVVTFIHASIWIWFFAHMEALSSMNGSSANLLLPALMTHFVLFVCAIVCSVMIGDGFTAWCDSIEDNNNHIKPGFSPHVPVWYGLVILGLFLEVYFGERDGPNVSYIYRSEMTLFLAEYQSLSWDVDRSHFYTYNQMALISSWLTVVFILFSVVMCCVHLYWDFIATFYTKSKKQGPLETSGFSDNGVSILNKLALNYSTDMFYTDTDSDFDMNSGGAAAAAGGGAHSKKPTKTDSSEDIVVSATVHTPEESPNTSDGVRSRGNAVVNK